MTCMGKMLTRFHIGKHGITAVLISLCCFSGLMQILILPSLQGVVPNIGTSSSFVPYILSGFYVLSFAGCLFWIGYSKPDRWHYSLPFLIGMLLLAGFVLCIPEVSSVLQNAGVPVPLEYAFPIGLLLLSLFLVYPLSPQYKTIILILTGICAISELYSIAAFFLIVSSSPLSMFFVTDPHMLWFLRGIYSYLCALSFAGFFIILNGFLIDKSTARNADADNEGHS